MNEAREKIMEVIIRSPGSLFEEIVLACPGLTWNQVFCKLDRMSREGESATHGQRVGALCGDEHGGL